MVKLNKKQHTQNTVLQIFSPSVDNNDHFQTQFAPNTCFGSKQMPEKTFLQTLKINNYFEENKITNRLRGFLRFR